LFAACIATTSAAEPETAKASAHVAPKAVAATTCSQATSDVPPLLTTFAMCMAPKRPVLAITAKDRSPPERCNAT
jgi:hypothetical protein